MASKAHLVVMNSQPLYLNGKWVVSEQSIKVSNPATGLKIGQVSTIDRGRIGEAVQDAHRAFLLWRQQPARARGEFLHKIAAELELRAAEVARTITLEN